MTISDTRLLALTRELLDASTLCAISTVGPRNRAHINTAYFAWDEPLVLAWISDPASAHSRNLRRNDSTAIAVYDSSQTWGRPDRGIQLFGTAQRSDDARGVYARRFAEYEGQYEPYLFRPVRVKLFDERALGAGTFVVADVERSGKLRRRRTDVIRSGR